jgi:hypothetical protein
MPDRNSLYNSQGSRGSNQNGRGQNGGRGNENTGNQTTPPNAKSSLLLIGILASLGHIFSSTNQMPLLVSNILCKSSFLLQKSSFVIITPTMLVNLVVVIQ